MKHGDRIRNTPFFFGELVWMGEAINPGRHNYGERHRVGVGRVYPAQGGLLLAMLPGYKGWPDKMDKLLPAGAIHHGHGWYVSSGMILPLGWFPSDGNEWRHRKVAP